MKNMDHRDVIGGALVVAAGLFFALYSRRYGFGSAERMGPGYFPTVLGWVLVALGVLIALPALRRGAGAPLRIQWGNFAWVIGSILLFAATLQSLGLITATFLASFMASLADREITWRGRVSVAIGVTVVTVLIFSVGLNMMLPLVWWE